MPKRLAIIVCILVALLAPEAAARAQGTVLLLNPGPATTVRAGTSDGGSSGTAAKLTSPRAMAQDAQGNLYIADTRNHRIRKVAADGTTTTIAGTGVQGFSGDEGPAAQAQLDSPAGLAVSSTGDLYLADTRNHRIRRIDATGRIHTVAGTGKAGMGGDGGPAIAALLASPGGVAINAAGELFIADTGNHRIRRITANGTIFTFAGSGVQAATGDGGPARNAALNDPVGLAFRADGSLLIADTGNDRVRIVTPDGTIQTLAVDALQLRRPQALAITAANDLLIADTGNFRIAQVSATGAGTALGSGVQGDANTAIDPALSPFGAAAAVVAGTQGSFLALDHDRGRAIQVQLPVLSFPDTLLASSSLPQTLTLRNPGKAAIDIGSIALPSAFQQGSATCAATPFQLAAGASCSISLLFTPASEGASSGTLQVGVDGGAPQRALLRGTGVRAGTLLSSTATLQSDATISYAGTPINFTALILGSSSPTPVGSVTFLDGSEPIGAAPLNALAQATTSTRSLANGNHTITARFPGDTIYQASTSLPLQLTVVPAPDFLLTATSATRIAIKASDPGTMSVTLQPSNGILNRNIAIKVDGLPTGTTVNITPATILLADSPLPVTITFKLPVAVTSNIKAMPLSLAILLLPFAPLRSRRRILPVAALLALLALEGCGGGFSGSSSTVTAQSATQTYPVTVTASTTGITGDALSHAASFTVVVQP